jgi:hypothetical protein
MVLRKTTPFISNQKMLGGTGCSFVKDMHDGRLGKKRSAGFASENAPGKLTPCSTEAISVSSIFTRISGPCPM